MASRPPKPEGTSWLSPFLCVKDVGAAVAFYERAFGFQKRNVIPGPDGKPVHAEVEWKGIVMMMGPENEFGKTPNTLGGVSTGVYVYVEDVDTLFERARKEGAEVRQEPKDMLWGDRICMLADADGNAWTFATNVADPDFSKM